MRDPYLYEDAEVLRNLAGIKNEEFLRNAEADITGIAMACMYNFKYDKFNIETLKDIHKNIFGQIYSWAGEFRTIQMVKPEYVLGGDTVRYANPKEIKRLLNDAMKEVSKLKRNGKNDRDVVFKLARITASIWQIHPFREGNTRSIVVFAVLLAKHLGFDVDQELLKENASYVRNALVWGSQGIYSKFEYLERIFFDAILHDSQDINEGSNNMIPDYKSIGDYNLKDYRESPHRYVEK